MEVHHRRVGAGVRGVGELSLSPPLALSLSLSLSVSFSVSVTVFVSERQVTPPSPNPQAFHEGGVAGVAEGLAPMERRLPPLECLRGGWSTRLELELELALDQEREHNQERQRVRKPNSWG